MNAFYFGSSERQLFGMYDPPQTREGPTRGVVLCYPWGPEYLLAHRSFRQLARLLSEAGYHVLRFDYYGSGDSAGEGTEGDVETWLENLAAAIEELKIMAGLHSVSVVGLRLGAALAAMSAVERRDIDTIVLWDPVIDGKEYLAELRKPGEPAVRLGKNDHRAGSAAHDVEVSGFPLTHGMSVGLEAIEAQTFATNPPRRLLLVVSNEHHGYTSLRTSLDRCNAAFTYEHIPGAIVWKENGELGIGAMPVQMLRYIVSWAP